MLSQTAEHALRALLHLAQHEGRGPVSAEAVADAIGAPRNYLSKTLNALAKAGLVSSLRGPTGGFRLAVPAEELSLGRVVEAFGDPLSTRGVCLLGGRVCDESARCPAHDRWKAVWRESAAPLWRTTLADLLPTG